MNLLFSQQQGLGFATQDNLEHETLPSDLITMVFIDANSDIIVEKNKLFKAQLPSVLIAKRSQCQDCLFTLKVHAKANLRSIVDVLDVSRGVNIELANIEVI